MAAQAGHLRAVSTAHEWVPEEIVLGHLVVALDEALSAPSLSIGWRASLRTARKHLADAAGPPNESPPRKRRQAPLRG